MYFPVFVEGAKLSMGDMHFSQVGGLHCGSLGICIPNIVTVMHLLQAQTIVCPQETLICGGREMARCPSAGR